MFEGLFDIYVSLPLLPELMPTLSVFAATKYCFSESLVDSFANNRPQRIPVKDERLPLDII
jgi:hypothetical protein